MKGDRGVIKHLDKYSIPLDFENFLYAGEGGKMSITPMDVDLFLEYHNKCFLIGEAKHENGNFDENTGYMRAIKRLCLSIGKPAILVLAYYSDDDVVVVNDGDEYPREVIQFSKCNVYKYISNRHSGGCLKPLKSDKTVKELYDWFVKGVDDGDIK